MEPPAPWMPSRRFLMTLSLIAVLGCGDGPLVHPPTNAIIQDQYNFQNAALAGEINSPQFPVGIPFAPYDTTFAGVVTAGNPTKDPLGFLEIQFYDGDGPMPPGCAPADCTNENDHTFADWQIDPSGFKIASLSGNYVAARGRFGAPRQDYMDVFGKFWYQGNSYDFLGAAVLPWKHLTSTSSIAGSSNAVFPGEMLWVQAFALLPEPISYSWTVDGEPQVWNSAFITTGFSTNGSHTITATLTGSNQAQVQLDWDVWVKCPPPADPYAFYCP